MGECSGRPLLNRTALAVLPVKLDLPFQSTGCFVLGQSLVNSFPLYFLCFPAWICSLWCEGQERRQGLLYGILHVCLLNGAQLNAAVVHGVCSSCTARSVPIAHSVVILSRATVTDTQRWHGLPSIHPLSSVLRQVTSSPRHWREKVCKMGT